MDILYPRIPRHRLWPMARIALLGAVIAGAYGAVHDQISYSISPEYFTKLKFVQFSWADVGLPDRGFASEVGFLASWWVGLFAGWFLARVGLVDLREMALQYAVVKSFAIVTGVAIVVGTAGALLGVEITRDGRPSAWSGSARFLGVHDIRAFEIVACLHFASYVGAALGLAGAMVYVRRSLSVVRQQVTATTAFDTASPRPTPSSPRRGGRQ
ncbi:MAG TPA: hypothetical protein VL371_20390 [Gemmataceae bacterium]|jgi:hypothetical protein|nr:hypothetical protein [Gemmataceae bacterium]